MGPTLKVRGSGKIRQHLFIPYNAKIADINEADGNKHTLNLTTALTENRKIIAIICGVSRIAGAGNLRLFPNEGGQAICYATDFNGSGNIITLLAGSNRLQYQQSAGTDDFDLYCFGYVVEV